MADVLRHETYQKVVSIISSVLKISQDTIHPNSTFEQLRMDSLDAFEMIMRIEEALHVEISDQLAADFKNVDQVVDALYALQQENINKG